MFEISSLPVDAPLRITSKFGPRNTGIKGASTDHKGVDMGRDFSKTETAILAVKAGTVSANYWNAYRGWVVTVKHNDTYTTLYQHLKARSPLAVGTRVKAGEKIGIMGASSDKKVLKVGTHLHFELRENGTPINPEAFLYNIKTEVTGMTENEIKELVKSTVKEVLDGTGTKASSWFDKEFKGKEKELAEMTDGSRPQGYAKREEVWALIARAVNI